MATKNIDHKASIANKKSYLGKSGNAAALEGMSNGETVEGEVKGHQERDMPATEFREAGKALYIKVLLPTSALPVTCRVPDPDTQADFLAIGTKVTLKVNSFEKETINQKTGEKDIQQYFDFAGFAADSSAATEVPGAMAEKPAKK